MPGQRSSKKRQVQSDAVSPKNGAYFCASDAPWGGFINIKLDEEQAATFVEWFKDHARNVDSLVDDILAQSAKITLAYDGEHEAYISTISGAIVSGSSERYVATSRAGTLIEALALLAWKHFYVCDGDYGNYKPSNGSFMKWG